jgi:hypothetical protein
MTKRQDLDYKSKMKARGPTLCEGRVLLSEVSPEAKKNLCFTGAEGTEVCVRTDKR